MILIVSHITDLNGPTERLIEYLKENNIKFKAILLPFFYSKRAVSFVSNNRIKILNLNFKNQLLNIIKDSIIISIYIFVNFFFSKKIKIAIGINPMNFFIINIFSFINYIKVKKKILYTIDWVDERYQISFINKFYHFIDKKSTLNAHKNWVVSKKIIDMKKKYYNVCESKFVHVPIGIRNSKAIVNKKNTFNICYVGAFHKEKGIEVILQAIEFFKIKNQYNLNFHLIGKTPENLKKIYNYEEIITKNYSNIVKISYFENTHDLDQFLIDMDVGIALFNPHISGNISKYSDPSKVKDYLTNDIVVIMNSYNPISELIKKRNLGLLIDYNSNDLVNAILSIYKEKQINLIRKNIVNFKPSISWDNIFSNALKDKTIIYD